MKKLCLFFSLVTCLLVSQYSVAAEGGPQGAPAPQPQMMNAPPAAQGGQAPEIHYTQTQGQPIHGGVVNDPVQPAPQGWERDMGNGYICTCCYKPCYYYTCECEQVPQYCYNRCCRYVPQYYQVQRCRYVPQYYCETCCRQVPQYYYTCECKQCPKYTYHRQCKYEPQYSYRCCPQPCCEPCPQPCEPACPAPACCP